MEWNGNAIEIFETTMLRHRALVSGLGYCVTMASAIRQYRTVCIRPFSIAMQLRIALTLTSPICIHLLYC